jgi:peptide/nickel transport system substrate-binding protein
MRFVTKLMSTLIVSAVAFAASASAQTTVRIGLAEDPDNLDPTLAGSFVGRIVFAGVCDKLFDIDANLGIVPQLALAYEWSDGNRTLDIRLRPNVVFHDGTPMDAEAVKFTLERHLTMQGSFRRGEISALQTVEVTGPLTVRLRLSAPFAPILAHFADRAGLIVSPTAARAAGPNFGNNPVCAGPFRFVERVAQSRIVLERFPQYWNASEIHVDRVVYQPIPDSTVRLANLQAGALELIERVQPSDMPAIQRDNRLRLVSIAGVGYQGITFNVANGERARLPIGANARVREALDLAIDRNTINEVVYNGAYAVSAQPNSPVSPYHLQSIPVPARNVERARALLRETGLPLPVVVNMMIINAPDQRQQGEVIQSMAREAGFDIRLQATEFAASLQAGQRGEFEAYLIGWSGRIDPDANQTSHIVTGAPFNWGHYSNAEVDRLMALARTIATVPERNAVYEQIMRIIQAERPLIYLYHPKYQTAFTARLTGFQAMPDGIIRFQGVRLAAPG